MADMEGILIRFSSISARPLIRCLSGHDPLLFCLTRILHKKECDKELPCFLELPEWNVCNNLIPAHSKLESKRGIGIPIMGISIPTMGTLLFDQIIRTLFGKVRRKVLALFYFDTDASFNVNEVIRELDLGIGAVHRELKALMQKTAGTLRLKLLNSHQPEKLKRVIVQ